ncbi:plasma membrane calciumhypothetical proteintransporting atpase 2 [Bipolaris maydis]|nr:plasma membrane calciumhypothetical proteintransporting atpase 2 [Bipolaris maydis]
MPRQQRSVQTSREGRISLAITSCRSNPKQSLRALAMAFDIPRSTLQTRVSGTKPRSEIRPANCKLSPIEEQSLVQWILDLDRRGFPPYIIDVRRMADALLAARGQNPPPQPTGKKWVSRFIQSQPELQTKWTRRLNSQRAQYEDPTTIAAWFKLTVGLSENGWTTDQLGVEWVKHFNQHTAARTAGVYRLLILDGHSSHATLEFDQYCTENKIITLCMPPYTSHLLQPLDVSCYSPLKRAYGREFEELARHGVYHVDKTDFLAAYTRIRPTVFTQQNIQAGFRATGLVSSCPDRVLSSLTVARTPSPPQTTTDNNVAAQALVQTETPHTVEQLQQQVRYLQEWLRREPEGLTSVAMRQLAKSAQLAMQSATILAEENKKLRAENQRQQQKQNQQRQYIAAGGVLQVQQAQQLTTEAERVVAEAEQGDSSQRRQRAPPTDSEEPVSLSALSHLMTSYNSKPSMAAENFIHDLSGYLFTGNLSDLTLTFGEKSWQIHKALACCHSTWFQKAVTTGFKESQCGVITLDDDSEFADAIECMVSYFYNVDYNVSQYDTSESLLHAQVANIADKYDCASLYKLARTSFANAVNAIEKNDWVAVATFVYNHTIIDWLPHRDLRDLVVATVANRPSVLKSILEMESTPGLLRSTLDLATDFLLTVIAVQKRPNPDRMTAAAVLHTSEADRDRKHVEVSNLRFPSGHMRKIK